MGFDVVIPAPEAVAQEIIGEAGTEPVFIFQPSNDQHPGRLGELPHHGVVNNVDRRLVHKSGGDPSF